MIPWLQAEEWESPDWDLVLPLILGYIALGGSLAVNSVLKDFITHRSCQNSSDQMM